MTTLTWHVDFDWDNDGVFEADETSRCESLRSFRGQKNWLKQGGKGFERPQVGTLQLTLDNDDGRFDPLNTSSPIYGDAKPGRECKVTVHDGTALRSVFRGKVKDIDPVGVSGSKRVRIYIEDGWRSLNKKVRKALQASMPTDTGIGHILDEAAWPSAWGRSLGAGSDTLGYWWVDGEIAADAIMDLVESEFGQFYIGGDGKAYFTGRHALYAASATATITQSQLLNDIHIPQPWDSVRNIVQIRTHPREPLTSAVELWRLREKPYIGAGETLEVFAEFKYQNRVVPGLNVITPVVSTDYFANTAPDSSGTDLTSGFTISTFTVFGTTAKIIVTNGSGLGGYVTLLSVRGTAVDAPDTAPVEVDASSGSEYEAQPLEIDLPWQQNVLVATDFANYLVNLIQSPLAYPVVSMVSQPTIQFVNDLFTRGDFTIGSLGISGGDYYVMGIEHEWISRNGQGVKTTWWLRPVDPTEYWIFTTSLGVTSRFGY